MLHALLFLCLLLNSPLGHTPSLQQVSPLGVAALFTQQQIRLNQLDETSIAASVTRALLIPSYAWHMAVSGVGSLSSLYAGALDHATEGADWWTKCERQAR